MNDSPMLAMLKIDLGITTTKYDARLAQYLESAKAEIEREGVNFASSLSVEDSNIIIQYAAWMWRKRDTGEGMPRILRWLINNRLFSTQEITNDVEES